MAEVFVGNLEAAAGGRYASSSLGIGDCYILNKFIYIRKNKKKTNYF